MRILTGKYKFFKLEIPKKISFSPISSYLRETIFNILTQKIDWNNSIVVDLFAGTGVLGIEALSRESKFVFFNDISAKNIIILKKNLENKEKISDFSFHHLPYRQFLLQLKQQKKKIDLIFIDPPFNQSEMIVETMNGLDENSLMNTNGVAVVLSKKNIEIEKSNWTLFWNKKYGSKILSFWKFTKKKHLLNSEKKSKFLIISGPSGVGKKKIISKLIAHKIFNLSYSVSCTTREPRKNEVHGRDYFFYSKTVFENKIKKNEFLEHAKFVENYYGTSLIETNKLKKKGKNILFETEIIGAENLKKKLDSIYWIYIFPPSMNELKNRLIKRQTEKIDVITERLKKAQFEIEYIKEKNNFDFCIINTSIEQSVAEIKNFLQKKSFTSSK